jgi:hypothetical protein
VPLTWLAVYVESCHWEWIAPGGSHATSRRGTHHHERDLGGDALRVVAERVRVVRRHEEVVAPSEQKDVLVDREREKRDARRAK